MADVFNAIRHLVQYAELAYKNDDGVDFQMATDELKGEPPTCRFLQIVTPVWRRTEPGPASRITSNTGTDFPMKITDIPNPQRLRGFWSNVYTDLCYSITALEWEDSNQQPPGQLDLSQVLVHEGFLLAFNSLLNGNRLLNCIQSLERGMEGGKLTKFEICGHSLGGALATLCALWCRQHFPPAKITCVTLGSPRVGNVHFRTTFDDSHIDCYRLVHDSDPIPTLPDRYTELIPMRISPSNPNYHIRQRKYRHAGSPIWLHVGEEILLHHVRRELAPVPTMFTIGNPPEIQEEEEEGNGDPVFDSLQNWGVFSWRWVPYWTGRIGRVLWTLPNHDPAAYVRQGQEPEATGGGVAE
ncbi:alpha beta-hydrolase [Fusarium heterosporum]|uniref:Alpha beta-hydrolase n=1 Tax=Fusarium heterosporum TaxID=42747 RepID=A0A8H5SV83_FUSHE|nr:alpha beta-hydrolase [Fusarium heterosporum]